MKNKVVVKTKNNARILTNPPDLHKYAKVNNAYVNPDLEFVSGTEPHYWKFFPPSHSLSVWDAERIVWGISKAIRLSHLTDHKKIFYKSLESNINEGILEAKAASDVITKLLHKADTVYREAVINKVRQELIKPKKSRNTPEDPNNKIYDDLCEEFMRGQVVPMLESEKSVRSEELKSGVINSLDQLKNPFSMTYLLLALAAIMIGLLYWNFR